MELVPAIFCLATLLVRVGLLLYVSGLSRSKNAAGTALRSMLDVCIVALSVWAVGAAFVSKANGPVIGFDTSYLFGWKGVSTFACVLPLLASGVVSAASGERSKFWPMCVASVLLGAILLPILLRWQSTGGWLMKLQMMDIAGTNLLIAAAVCAAVGASFVGPRPGKYHRDGSVSIIPGHNIPQALTGAMLMLAGWTGVGGILSLPVALNVLLGGSAGAVVAAAVTSRRYGKPDVLLCCSGLLAGALSGLAGGETLPATVAVITGAVSSILAIAITAFLDVKLRIDDPSGLIAVNLAGPMIGLLANGVNDGLRSGHFVQRAGVQLLGIVTGMALSYVVSYALFALLALKTSLRSSEADEYDGLDLAEHEINAYPDFQQTMIKSYHTREA